MSFLKATSISIFALTFCVSGLREYNEFLQKQLSEKEQRFVEQTDRLRKVQDELFTLKEANSDLKLELALKRCERKKCGDREPQNGY